MVSKWKITYSMLTDQGGRKVNEDYLGVIETPNRMGFILCDGLGGHGMGDVASHFVVDKIRESIQAHASLEESILYAQNELLEKQETEHAGNSMKTTVVCLTITEDSAQFGYVGDSRFYHFEKNKYIQRSLDHSVPQMLVMRGDIREKDIRHHEDRNRLLRVMGTFWDSPKYQLGNPITLTGNTSFLLCSDGFWELIDERQMCKTLKKAKSPEEWLQNMWPIVVKNGRNTNMDNYSAIAVFVRDKA